VQRYAVDSGAYESCGYAEGDVVPRGVDFPIRAEEAYLISLQSPLLNAELNDATRCNP
jgi:hypothetical protein